MTQLRQVAAQFAFLQPAGTVAVNFTVDDTANKVFTTGSLDWKGSFKANPPDGGAPWDRIILKDPLWTGPYPPLFDDGPWRTGGHEPSGSTAGDHLWGVTVFAPAAASVATLYEYGLIDHSTGGWLWYGPNGSFQIQPGATGEVTAPGMTLLPFGTTDLKVVVDTGTVLDGGVGTWDTRRVEVKGSAWAWNPILLADDGLAGDDVARDGRFTFLLSSVVGPGHLQPHSGLLNSNDVVQFVVVLGGVEYKSPPGGGGTSLSTGVTAFARRSGGTFTTLPLTVVQNNSAVTIP
jgi:hypothetical protein